MTFIANRRTAIARAGLVTLAAAAALRTSPAAFADVPSAGAVDAALRDLWIGHIFYVRDVAVATVAGNAAAAKAGENAVVANAKAIAGSIEPFYGAAAKDALFKLLAGHYGAVKSYLLAAVADSKAKEQAATTAINDNAEQIATFLSGANPNLPKDTVLGLLQAHGGHHIAQIQQLIAKDYAGELQTWADMTNHMYVIADALAGAIAKQFPDKIKA
jgi:hypothetical protein